jgi:hypothetical protein
MRNERIRNNEGQFNRGHSAKQSLASEDHPYTKELDRWHAYFGASMAIRLDKAEFLEWLFQLLSAFDEQQDGDDDIDGPVLLDILWKAWHEQPVQGDPMGDRIFARFVEVSEEEPHWYHWHVIGLIRDTSVNFVGDPDPSILAIRKSVAAGDVSGDVAVGTRWVQWVRCRLDRPPGTRAK